MTIPLLGIYQNEVKLAYERLTCTPMFFTSQFTMANIRNQLKYPLTSDLMDYYWEILKSE